MPLARFDGSVLDNVPRPVPGAQIAVLTQPANTSTQPGSPLASIFSDVNGSFPLANPFSADGTGNYFFYAAAGSYTVQIYGGTLAAPIVLADQALGTPAAGVSLQHNGIANSTQTLLNLAQGSGITIAEAAGTVTVTAAASAVTFKTNGTNNGSQTTLNLAQGSGITIVDGGSGTITFSAASGAVFQTNGVSNSSQATLNLQNGTNVTITNPSAGNVSFAVAWPIFQTNGTPNSTQSPLNFQSGANIQVSNPSAGNVSFAAFNIVAKASTVDFTAQTAALTTTNFPGGPFASGQYLLCWNAKVTTAGTTSTLGALTITYTDPDTVVQTVTAAAQIPAGTIATTVANGTTTTGLLIGVPLTLNIANASNITYAFAYASTGTPMQYNLHLRLEALPT